jgi:V/A-type H+-transporting ATPase subunit I
MFARPQYGEIDPTPFIAPVFLLFFGLMLGDAAYGICITLAGYLLYRGAGKVSETMHDMSILLIGCGVSAIIFGTLQGGWLGDFFPRFLGITPPLILLEPLKEPIAFFQIALILGVAHINLGLCLGLYQHIRRREYRAGFFEQGVWFIIQPAAGILLFDFFGWGVVPPLVKNAGYIGMALGLCLIFFSRGPMGFFALTGFLGDWLSYVRILALALATGGIAMTVNILAQIVGGIHPLMFIPAIIIFVGGQTFNLVIQTLGGVIHAVRLQYIEFFGKFYVGEGREFLPFRARRISTISVTGTDGGNST